MDFDLSKSFCSRLIVWISPFWTEDPKFSGPYTIIIVKEILEVEELLLSLVGYLCDLSNLFSSLNHRKCYNSLVLHLTVLKCL